MITVSGKLRFGAVVLLMLMVLSACSTSQKPGPAATPATPAAPAVAKDVPGIAGNQILIGSIGPLSGPVAYAGKATIDAMNLYFDYVNKQGGIHGRQIKFIPEDDAYDVAKTLAAARKLVTVDKVLAIAPIIGTANILGVREYLNTEKVVAFNGKSADPFLGNWPYLFGLGTPYEYQGAIAVDFIANDLGAKQRSESIYAVMPDDGYGNSQLKGIEPAAKELGVKLTVEKVPRTTDQFGGVVTNIKRSGAKYVIAGTARGGIAALMRESEAQGLDVTFMTANGPSTEAAIFDLAGKKYAEKYYGVHSVSLWEDESDPLIKWARDQFRAAGNQTALKEKSFFYSWGIIVAKTITEAIKQAGPDVTREKLAETLRNMENVDLGGGVAPFTFKGKSLLITGTEAKVAKGRIVDGVVGLTSVTPFRKSPIVLKFQ